jgi:hypothetical protein
VTNKSKPCGGTLYNGPGKRFTRCSVCGTIDWEANEGDRCRERLPLLPRVVPNPALPEGVAVVSASGADRVQSIQQAMAEGHLVIMGVDLADRGDAD